MTLWGKKKRARKIENQPSTSHGSTQAIASSSQHAQAISNAGRVDPTQIGKPPLLTSSIANPFNNLTTLEKGAPRPSTLSRNFLFVVYPNSTSQRQDAHQSTSDPVRTMSMGAEWDTLEAALEDHREGPHPETLVAIYEELIDAFAEAKAATAEHPETEWSIGVLQASGLLPRSLVSCKSLCRHFNKEEHGDCTCWFSWGVLPSTSIVGNFEWRSIEEGEMWKKWFPRLRESTLTKNGYNLAREWRADPKFGKRGLHKKVVEKHLTEAHGFARDHQGTHKLAQTFLSWSDGCLVGESPALLLPDSLREMEGTTFDLMDDDPFSIDRGISSNTMSNRAEATETRSLMIFEVVVTALTGSSSNGNTETQVRGGAAAQETDVVQSMPHGTRRMENPSTRESRTVSREGNDFSPLHSSPLRPRATDPEEDELLPEPGRSRDMNEDSLPAPFPLRSGLVDVDVLDANTSSAMLGPPGGSNSIEEDWDYELEPSSATSSTFVPLGRVSIRVRPARNRNQQPYVLTISEDGGSEVSTDTPQSLPADTPVTDDRQRDPPTGSSEEPQPEIGLDDGPRLCVHDRFAAYAMSNLHAQIRANARAGLILEQVVMNLNVVFNNALSNWDLNIASLQEEQQENLHQHQQWGEWFQQGQPYLHQGPFQQQGGYQQQGPFQQRVEPTQQADGWFQQQQQGPEQEEEHPDQGDMG